MLSVLTVFLYVAVVFIALLLICLVLIQPSKNGGTGAAFGSVGESVFGAQAGSHLTKATVVMTSLFFLLVLVLATVIGRGASAAQRDRGVERALETVEKAESSVAAVAGDAAASLDAVKAPQAPVAPKLDGDVDLGKSAPAEK